MKLPPVDGLETLAATPLRALREIFQRDGFGRSTIEIADSIAQSAPTAVRRLIVQNDLQRRSEPAFHLAALFCFRGSLPRPSVDARLGPDLTDTLIAAGLLAKTGESHLQSPFQVLPKGPAWILADAMLEDPESVMPPGPTTDTLEHLLPETMNGSMLDLGCGPGSLAIGAAVRGATRVVGTDVNPRAITLARFNARWNDLDVEFRCGDLFAPVARERFDLVVSQPPFVAHAETLAPTTFLHAGPRGDAIFLRIVAGLDAVLTPEGEALVLADIGLEKNGSIGEYLRAHATDVALHLLALHVEGLDAENHAVVYSTLWAGNPGPQHARVALEQRAHLAALGIESFRQVLLIARRPGPARRQTWRTAMPIRDVACAVPRVRTRLWTAIRGAGETDATLLRRRIRVAPDAQWVSLRRAPEGEQSEHRVRFGAGWPALEQVVTDEGLALASLLERSADVAGAIAGYAAMCDATPEEVREPLLDYIRRSLLSGMLVIEEDTDDR